MGRQIDLNSAQPSQLERGNALVGDGVEEMGCRIDHAGLGYGGQVKVTTSLSRTTWSSRRRLIDPEGAASLNSIAA